MKDINQYLQHLEATNETYCDLFLILNDLADFDETDRIDKCLAYQDGLAYERTRDALVAIAQAGDNLMQWHKVTNLPQAEYTAVVRHLRYLEAYCMARIIELHAVDTTGWNKYQLGIAVSAYITFIDDTKAAIKRAEQ